jgi:phosphorylase kinase gamma subunit
MDLTVVLFIRRGVSSTVRRCIEKETGREFAAKIIDLAGQDPGDCEALREATLREISILREVAGHPYISTSLLRLLSSFRP